MREYYFRFSGATGEYFKIWLVNILLTLLTLGAFSAWAKVRNKRYFYGNLFLMDSNFEYHASPWSILIARVILLAVVIGGAVWAGEDALRNAEYSLLLLALLPWALVRGLSFNARNSSYRNARFSFRRGNRSYLKMYLAYTPFIVLFAAQTLYFLAFPQLDGFQALGKEAIVTVAALALILFLLTPWFTRLYHSVKASGHAWGQMPFAFEAPLWRYFWVITLQLAVISAFLWGMEFVFDGIAQHGFPGAVFVYIIAFPLLFLLYFTMLRAQLFKLYWQNIRLPQGGRVVCRFSALRFGVGILLVNFILTLLSFGLLYPWAAIRRARFLAANMSLTMDEAALALALSSVEKEGAFGEEFDATQGFDFDVALI